MQYSLFVVSLTLLMQDYESATSVYTAWSSVMSVAVHGSTLFHCKAWIMQILLCKDGQAVWLLMLPDLFWTSMKLCCLVLCMIHHLVAHISMLQG